MKQQTTRREFFADVGRGMMVAGLGSALASDMGLGSVWAADAPPALDFGKLEPLVGLMQETGAAKLLPLLVDKLKSGTSLEELTSAAALANARTFGGEDYIGFHTLMALYPAYQMSREMPEERRPLPLLKVLYRNSNRIQEKGGRKNEVLHPVQPAAGKSDAAALREAIRRKDMNEAESTFAALAQGSAADALNDLLPAVQDATEVHRVVLVARAWELIDLVGKERAHTLLRQSVHFCVKAESNPRYPTYFTEIRGLLPKLFDQHRLDGRAPGKRTADDAWVEQMSQTIFKSNAAQAAEAAAAALADGFAPEALAEAIALAVNQLILRDNGRPSAESPQKPAGSCHGDSIGVHACDSANAWRKLAAASNPRNAFACIILAAYQAAKDRGDRGGDFLKWEPYPRADARDRVKAKDAEGLLREAEEGIKAKDQAIASAAIHRYGELNQSPRPVFDLLLRYATSEDGALHAEKYYRTVSEEFNFIRPAYRWRQLVGLARVTASEYGQPAPGYADACKLLKV